MIRRKNKKRRENHETQDENNNAASSDYAVAMPDTGSGCRWRERSEDRSGGRRIFHTGGAGRRKRKSQRFFPHSDAGKRGEDVCTAPVEQLQL